MTLNWLRKLFGIKELQERIILVEKKNKLIEEERADLESRVIKANETTELIQRSVEQAELTERVIQYLAELKIEITDNSSEEALMAMKVAQVVERYGFRRFIPPLEQTYPTRVISLKDLQKHPEEYLHKLSKGFMGFPIGLNFDGVNKILENMFCNCNIFIESVYSNNGFFRFTLGDILGYGKVSSDANEILVQATKLSDLDREGISCWISIDPLDFLTNYEGLKRFILEIPNLREEAKYKGICALEAVRFAYLTALEIVGTTRIKDPSELLNPQQEMTPCEEVVLSTELNPNQLLKQKIKKSLLSQTKGTTYRETQELLPIRSKERFRKLASERTLEILAKDEERKGLTYTIEKHLDDYSVGESIILSCYFARNIIQHYETLDDAVKAVLSNEKQGKISGQCTDYTGLALHYLKGYLMHLHPEKFENWFFGFDKDVIGDYKHCYIKALHINHDQTVDVYFLDPTKLANEGIKAFKTPEEITKMMDISKYPILIKRDAEDLLQSPIL